MSADEEDIFTDEREHIDRPMRRLFTEYGRKHPVPAVIALVSNVSSPIVALLPAYFLSVSIDALFTEEQPLTLPLVPDGYLPEATPDQLLLMFGLITGAFVLNAFLTWAGSWGWALFAERVQHEVRTDAYEKMQHLGMDFFADKQTGELMSVLTSDVNRLEDFLNGWIGRILSITVTIIGVIAIITMVNWQLALLVLVPGPLMMLISHQFVQVVRPKYREARSTYGSLASRLENNLSGIEVVKAFTTEAFEAERVTESSGEHKDARWSARRWGVRFGPGLTLVSGMGFAVVFIVGGWWLMFGSFLFFTGPITVGTLVLSLQYAQRITGPMSEAGILLNNYERVKASAERVYVLKDYPPNVPEAADAVDLGDVSGDVAFDDVSFAYDPAEEGFAEDTEDEADDEPDRAQPEQRSAKSGDDDGDDRSLLERIGIRSTENEDEDEGSDEADESDDNGREQALTNIDFEAEAGEMIGLVGPTGSGKSTLMKLLMRFYDVGEGAVRVDGNDVRDISIRSLRNSIGYVSQEPFLFTGTVRDNIAYGIEADDEDIEAAAKIANAHDFIVELEDGYDTEVGQEGGRLSGGQRQRIAIARVVLKDPEIIILDEATSHVDNETEVLIQNSLEDLIADRTTFAIAHRLSTVRNADRILVLEDGEIVERGSHEDLLVEDGLYANLWHVQVGEVDSLPEEFLEQAAARDRA